MQLNEFYDYKNTLMGDIITNQTIVELIDESKTQQTAYQLAYTNIFPYEYIPDTVEHGETFICFDVDIQKAMNKTFYQPTIYIWVFTHKSLLRIPEGGIRPDRITEELAKMLNGSRMYGLGELDLYSVRRFAPMTDYQGKVMTFYAEDFNRPHPSDKVIPANRKRG